MTHPHSEKDAADCTQTASNQETQLQTLHQQYLALETEYARCQEELKRMQEKSDRLEEHLYLMQDSYDLMINSSGHRLLEKYYALSQLLRPTTLKSAIVGIFEPVLQKLRHLKNRWTHQLTRDDKYLLLTSCQRIDILTDELHRKEALQFQSILTEVGITCEIHTSQPAKYQDCPYIVFEYQPLTQLPDLFMTFSRAVPTTEEQQRMLSDAYAVFVPTIEMVSELKKIEGLSSQIFHMPLEAADLKYHLYRFLLAVDRISFDWFYEEVGSYVRLTGDRICLSLPESPERRASFEADNAYEFEVFNGLKHHLGWIGCGLSYKFIFRKALEQNKAQLLVCEDDVYFPADFEIRFKKVLEYAEANSDWSIFSGVMGDMGDVTVLDCVQKNGLDLVYLDKMMSMVFNLYTPAAFNLISRWDSNNRDKKTNTIDRYLEDKCHRVLTTCPFLVGHKEDLDSTIWNHKNDLYNAGIENSSKKLHLLVDRFLYQKNRSN